ncbi:MAG: T9SS type A sorting domain-containing protein [Bacteroidia bacterium]|nr:T9SS type A sorting domain-containing protein [Bacteroidia bacterium]
MKKFLILSFFTLAYLIMEAQSYSFVTSISEQAWQVVPGQNGSFYTVTWLPNCPDDYISIRYFNKMGEVVNTFSSPPYIGSISSISAITNSLNNIVIYLLLDDINHMLYEFDSTGTMVWNNTIQFTDPQIKYTKLVQSATGYYLLGNTYTTLWTDSAHAIITKLSPNGNHQWTKYYRMNNSNPASTHFNDMLYENNLLICVGRYYYTNEVVGQVPGRPVVSLLDTAGNLLQSYYYMVDSNFIGFDKYEFVQLDKTPSGKYYLVGNDFGNEHALFKMDSSFNIEWIMEKLSGKSTAMCAGYNEDVFISPEGEHSNFALQFDSAGNVIGDHVTKNPSASVDFTFGHITSLYRHNCGFLFSNDETMIAHTDHSFSNCLDSSYTGYINYYPVNTFFRRTASLSSGFLTSFDEYSMTQGYHTTTSTAVNYCLSVFSCDSISEIIHESRNYDEINIYPDPAKEHIYISFPGSFSGTRMQLYDISGKKIREEFYNVNGIHSVEVYDLSGGIYMLKLISPTSVVVRKIIIEK